MCIASTKETYSVVEWIMQCALYISFKLLLPASTDLYEIAISIYIGSFCVEWYSKHIGSCIWRACFQNLLHPVRHVTHLHNWLPMAIIINFKYSSLVKYIPNVGSFHLMYSTLCTKWLKMWTNDMQKWT